MIESVDRSGISLRTEPHGDQQARWPREGRHILAQFDDETVIVYQAYRPSIARYAVDHQRFGGDFSFSRMSWIKPNFLWMMFRCGWATKEGQEHVLAIHLRRTAFKEILGNAVHSTFQPDLYPSPKDWSSAVARSDVRLQWDPDHSPQGGPLVRRAIQLGLRGATLRSFGTEWVTRIEDVTDFVVEQRRVLAEDPSRLVTPAERVYPLTPPLAGRLGADVQENEER